MLQIPLNNCHSDFIPTVMKTSIWNRISTNLLWKVSNMPVARWLLQSLHSFRQYWRWSLIFWKVKTILDKLLLTSSTSSDVLMYYIYFSKSLNVSLLALKKILILHWDALYLRPKILITTLESKVTIASVKNYYFRTKFEQLF